MAIEEQYQRLPGRGVRFEGSRVIGGRRATCSLWLGSDHLLSIETAGYTQEYKRFYYRDIQALVVRRTNTGKIWNVILGPLAGVFGLIALGVHDPAGAIVLWIICGMFFGFLLMNIFRGTTCATHIKTAVQMEQLAALSRLRAAENAIAKVKERIQATQGVLETTAAQEQAKSSLEAALSQPAATRMMYRPAGVQEQTKPYQSRAHLILFSLLLADGLLNICSLFWHGVPVILISMLVSVGATAAAIASLLKQYQTDLRPALRRLTWVIACYFAVNVMVSYIQYMVLAEGDPNAAQNQWLLMKRYAAISPSDNLWLFYMLLISGILSLGLGALGLFLLQRFEQLRRAATGAVPPIIQQPLPPASELQPPPSVS